MCAKRKSKLEATITAGYILSAFPPLPGNGQLQGNSRFASVIIEAKITLPLLLKMKIGILKTES